MSDRVARETFRAITADELLEVHARLNEPSAISWHETGQLFDESRVLFGFGRHLRARTRKAGWDKPLTAAIHSGSDRLFLSLLNWLQPEVPTEAQVETRMWLKLLPKSISRGVKNEVDGITKKQRNTDAVTEEIENELRLDYLAFVALSTDLESELLIRGRPIRETSKERLGAALAGLAISRQLARKQVSELNALFKL